MKSIQHNVMVFLKIITGITDLNNMETEIEKDHNKLINNIVERFKIELKE